MSKVFQPLVELGWKEYIVCARCGLVMGGPPSADRSEGWSDWAGEDTDARCSGCGATGADSLFHCSKMMAAVAAAGWPDPDRDPGPPPWRGKGLFDKWTIPTEVREILLSTYSSK